MTTELTQPQSELGAVPANGQEQSQGHRRRRRRRKNKSSQAAARSLRIRRNRRRQILRRSIRGRPQSTSRSTAPRRAPGRTPESGTEEEEVFPEGLGGGSAAGQQHFSSTAGQAQGEAEGAQGVCGSDGPQLPPGERQHSRRTSLDYPYRDERPQQLSGRV